jgi:hypothetical protein
MSDRILEFKTVVKVLPCLESNYYRTQYIERFVNINTEYYTKNIATTSKFHDGECYNGYLWDTLFSWQKIKFSDLENHLPSSAQKVLAFWDIHSSERIFIDNYWVFGKKDVIELISHDLLKYLDLLPEDLYILDRNLEWSTILTHETEGDEDWPASRIVLKALPLDFLPEPDRASLGGDGNPQNQP